MRDLLLRFVCVELVERWKGEGVGRTADGTKFVLSRSNLQNRELDTTVTIVIN